MYEGPLCEYCEFANSEQCMVGIVPNEITQQCLDEGMIMLCEGIVNVS